jgi:hypothetical protein
MVDFIDFFAHRIMHVVTREDPYCGMSCKMRVLTDCFITVSLTPTSIQASLGLQQCLLALKDLEVRFQD